VSKEKRTSIWLSDKFNAASLLVYMLLVLAASVLFADWFPLGDFSFGTVEWYHAVMIPFTLLLMIVAASVVGLGQKVRGALNLSTYPVMAVTALALPLMSTPTGEAIEGIRDAWVMLLAVVFDLALLLYPFRQREKFKRTFGAYLLLLFASVSATLAGLYGIIAADGMFVGFSGVPFLQSYVNSLGIGASAFISDLVTSHSHEMLPAVMGGIVALTALMLHYEELPPAKRRLVNLGMLVSLFGVVSMTYLYFISGLGTYSIPTIAPFGPGGMNGLALDDSQTGIVGWGALISLVGLWPFVKKDKVRIASVLTWLFAMLALIGIGYYIEFNESYYGFGSAGTPPNGGPGYLHDDAFMSGHLMLPFFFLPILAAACIYLDSQLEEGSAVRKLIYYLALSGMIIGLAGLAIFMLTLVWYVEATGIVLMGAAMAVGVGGLISTAGNRAVRPRSNHFFGISGSIAVLNALFVQKALLNWRRRRRRKIKKASVNRSKRFRLGLGVFSRAHSTSHLMASRAFYHYVKQLIVRHGHVRAACGSAVRG